MAQSGVAAVTKKVPLLKVLLADESREFRTFIRRLSEVEWDIEVVGEATNGHELLPLVRQLRPDVVLADIALSGMEGLEGARRIKAETPATRVILLSVVDEPALRVAAAKYGADVFLPKDAPISEIFSRIRGKSPIKSGPEKD
ncbi:MAG TPA: response regulator transcription factor [Candidatus Acidoferrales bacterium]|nr:response regulator transcription factor [Candidatus Acidoferrales bacterium]